MRILNFFKNIFPTNSLPVISNRIEPEIILKMLYDGSDTPRRYLPMKDYKKK